jgi:hypothetical protein
MNEQTSGQLRQLLQALGGIAMALGWLTTGQVEQWTQTILQAAGPLAMLAGVIWSYKVNRPVDLVASVVNMAKDPQSPVKGVVVENTMAGRELKNDLGAEKIATAGSVDAKAIAATG